MNPVLLAGKNWPMRMSWGLSKEKRLHCTAAESFFRNWKNNRHGTRSDPMADDNKKGAQLADRHRNRRLGVCRFDCCRLRIMNVHVLQGLGCRYSKRNKNLLARLEFYPHVRSSLRITKQISRLNKSTSAKEVDLSYYESLRDAGRYLFATFPLTEKWHVPAGNFSVQQQPAY
jgi:hypothetical protein